MIVVRNRIDWCATDGLSNTQRALIRHLLLASKPVRCSEVIECVLKAPGCPPDVSWEEVDAVMLAMAHPTICRCPALEYIGNPGSSDGWMPGPYYRMVAANYTMMGLTVADSADVALWNPSPLDLRVPFAMLFGNASWNVEADEGYPEDKKAQMGLRMSCHAIHCLACGNHSIRKAMNRFQETGTLDGCLTTIGNDSRPIACHSNQLQASIRSSLEQTRSSVAGLSSDTQPTLPHGRMVGCRLDASSSPESSAYLLSAPALVAAVCDQAATSGTALALEQPACGRHLGHEITLMQTLNDCTIKDAEKMVLEVGPGFDIQRTLEQIAVEPLSLEVYRQLLGGIVK